MVSGRPAVSIVATVVNEISNVDDWLTSLISQTLRPDEIVIVDGGSTDGTVDAVKRVRAASSVPIVLLEAPGANISKGRNLAIERATGTLIAVTDAGTRAEPRWLESLISPFISGDADVAAGFFVPGLASRWERALAAATLPDASDIAPDRFQPSSRSLAFSRRWFDAGLRYPEWLDYCEDLVWDLAMRRAGARFVFAPQAVVTFAVRPSPRSFIIQYARYARGDGKAGLFARRHAIRYATYAGLLIVLRRHRASELALTVLLGAAYVRRAMGRLWHRDRRSRMATHESLAAIPLVVALRAAGDLAKMAGYPAGLVWRWRRFGTIGWRSSWQRISPDGALFRPGVSTRGSRGLEVSPCDESRGVSH